MENVIYRYEKSLLTGILHRRYKRFLADVEILPSNGEIAVVHCPNSGSMLNMAPPHVPLPKCIVSLSNNPKNKYQHGLEMIQLNNTWVGINSALANKMVRSALERNLIPEVSGFVKLNQEVKRSEITEGNSVLNSNRMLLEVKSVTLTYPERSEVAEFPDAVSVRATKHANQLKNHVAQGGRAAILFLIQRSDVVSFSPCSIDKKYQLALHDAHAAGVLILPYKCELCPENKTVTLVEKVPYINHV
ncbi:unnamed protein product [Ectocarpus fasciculatus]